MGGRVGGGRIGHRDLVAYGSPIGTRQSFGDQHDVAHCGVIDHPWMEDSGHPVLLRPFDGGQFDGVARGNAEPAGGNLAQADLAVAQALPEPRHATSVGSYSAWLYQSPGVTPTTSRDNVPDEIVDCQRDDTLRPSAAPVTNSNVESESRPSR